MLSCFSCVQLFATLWTVACQAPLSMAFSMARILEWLPCPSPGDLPNLGIEPVSLMSLELAGRFFTTGTINAGDPASVPGLGRSHTERNGYPLHYSCLENPTDKSSSVHGVAKRRTQLSNQYTHKLLIVLLFQNNKKKYTPTPTNTELLPLLDHQSLCHLVGLRSFACVVLILAES